MKLVKIVKTDSRIVTILQTVICTKIMFRILVYKNVVVVHVSPELTPDQQKEIIDHVLSGAEMQSMILRAV